MTHRRSRPVGEEVIAHPFGDRPMLRCCSLRVADASYLAMYKYTIKTHCNKLGAEDTAIHSTICAQ